MVLNVSRIVPENVMEDLVHHKNRLYACMVENSACFTFVRSDGRESHLMSGGACFYRFHSFVLA